MARILIADDSVSNLYLLETILTACGYGVTVARNGAEALELARRDQPDLIIADILMPVMDGFALCREWKTDERLKNTPFIFYTATYTNPGDMQFALSLGVERFLVKPQQPEKLIEVVREVLGEGGQGSPGKNSIAEAEALRRHNEALVRKLEQKVEQLESEIAERERTEKTLRESEEKFRQLAENIHEGFWIRERGELAYVNPGFEQIFGLGGESLRQNPDSLLDIIHEEDRERFLRTRSGQDRKEVKSVEYRIVRPDGSVRWIYSRSFPIVEEGGIARTVGISEDITDRKQMEEQLQGRLREIEKLRKQLEQENISLREEVKLLSPYTQVVARSRVMQQIMVQVEQVAPTDSTVLITGETGVGKEVIARAIHEISARKSMPLVTINCASLPPTLIESELFGREKGAFTGAMSRMIGRFEIADRSTLFLDEIADLPLEVQAKLLRVLEEGRFERLGSTRPLKANVRILAATNRNLDQMVRAGKFRNDLYYRLNVFPISIPPLRERKEDIPLLIWAFVHQFEKRMGRQINSIPKHSLDALLRYSWPGNARELRNVVEHAMIVSRGSVLEIHPPSTAMEKTPETTDSLQEVERRQIMRVLLESGWRISGRGDAAEILGLKPTTLEARMKKLGISRPRLQS